MRAPGGSFPSMGSLVIRVEWVEVREGNAGPLDMTCLFSVPFIVFIAIVIMLDNYGEEAYTLFSFLLLSLEMDGFGVLLWTRVMTSP